MHWASGIPFLIKWGPTLHALLSQPGPSHTAMIIDFLEANSQVAKKYWPAHAAMLDDAIATLREIAKDPP